MPNHCSNIIHIKGTDEQVKNVLKYIIGIADDGSETVDFNIAVPMPEETKDSDNAIKLDGSGAMRMPDWYTWAMTHWGTKWNAYYCRFPNSDGDKIEFSTAWAPPSEWFVRLCELVYKDKIDVELSLEYSEPGCYFAGTIEYNPEDGTVCDNSLTGIELDAYFADMQAEEEDEDDFLNQSVVPNSDSDNDGAIDNNDNQSN